MCRSCQAWHVKEVDDDDDDDKDDDDEDDDDDADEILKAKCIIVFKITEICRNHLAFSWMGYQDETKFYPGGSITYSP